jgi:hypothetical protein
MPVRKRYATRAREAKVDLYVAMQQKRAPRNGDGPEAIDRFVDVLMRKHKLVGEANESWDRLTFQTVLMGKAELLVGEDEVKKYYKSRKKPPKRVYKNERQAA